MDFLKKHLRIIMYTFIIIYLITSMHFSIYTNDEAFTVALVKHSYYNIINLDSLDVHPPLYYLLLKLFLDITTFYTKSVFIEVFFSRIFSILSLILFMYIFKKILNISGESLKNGNYLWIVLFLCVPAIILFTTRIRMYSLASLFLIANFYELIKFIRNSKISCLICLTLFFILSEYTLYFTAISSGIYMFIVIIYCVKNKRYKNFFKLIIATLVAIIAYVPWIPVVYKQLIIHSHQDNSTGTFSFLHNIKNLITSLSQINGNSISLIFILFMCLSTFVIIYYSFKFNTKLFNSLFVISLLNGIITLIVILIICKNKFQYIAIYPIFMIYSAFIVFMITKILFITKPSRIIYKYLCVFVILMCIMFSIQNIYYNIKINDIPTIELINNFSKWKNNKSNLRINMIKYPITKKQHNINTNIYNIQAQNSIYLGSLHKKNILMHSNYRYLAIYTVNDCRNTKLVKDVFNVLNIRNN